MGSTFRLRLAGFEIRLRVGTRVGRVAYGQSNANSVWSFGDNYRLRTSANVIPTQRGRANISSTAPVGCYLWFQKFQIAWVCVSEQQQQIAYHMGIVRRDRVSTANDRIIFGSRFSGLILSQRSTKVAGAATICRLLCGIVNVSVASNGAERCRAWPVWRIRV